MGFPGESEGDVEVLCGFLEAARLDVVGVFGFSPEDGTEAAGLPGALDADEIAARVRHIGDLVEELTAQRADDRVGERVTVLVEEFDPDDGAPLGRAAHQGPDVDGVTRLAGGAGWSPPAPGDLVAAEVVGAEGVDLVAEPGP
jgi:tRNA A37 methylthiotransferase MiaB